MDNEKYKLTSDKNSKGNYIRAKPDTIYMKNNQIVIVEYKIEDALDSYENTGNKAIT